MQFSLNNVQLQSVCTIVCASLFSYSQSVPSLFVLFLVYLMAGHQLQVFRLWCAACTLSFCSEVFQCVRGNCVLVCIVLCDMEVCG